MIIEGIPTVLLGIAIFFLLPNDVDTAYFLTNEEKEVMKIRHGRAYGNTTSAQEFSKKDVMKAFKDWKVWMFCASQFGADTMLYGMFFTCALCRFTTTNVVVTGYSTFLPTIIRGLGSWTSAQVQLLTIPCYFLGATMYMSVAFLSDKTQKRGLFCVIFGTVSLLGYAILISKTAAGVHYFGYVSCFTQLASSSLTFLKLFPDRRRPLYTGRLTTCMATQ